MNQKLKYVNGKNMIVNHKNEFSQYFTKHNIAIQLFDKTKEIISQYENLDKYT